MDGTGRDSPVTNLKGLVSRSSESDMVGRWNWSGCEGWWDSWVAMLRVVIRRWWFDGPQRAKREAAATSESSCHRPAEDREARASQCLGLGMQLYSIPASKHLHLQTLSTLGPRPLSPPPNNPPCLPLAPSAARPSAPSSPCALPRLSPVRPASSTSRPAHA